MQIERPRMKPTDAYAYVPDGHQCKTPDGERCEFLQNRPDTLDGGSRRACSLYGIGLSNTTRAHKCEACMRQGLVAPVDSIPGVPMQKVPLGLDAVRLVRDKFPDALFRTCYGWFLDVTQTEWEGNRKLRDVVADALDEELKTEARDRRWGIAWEAGETERQVDLHAGRAVLPEDEFQEARDWTCPHCRERGLPMSDKWRRVAGAWMHWHDYPVGWVPCRG